jgi:hypothetical protein
LLVKHGRLKKICTTEVEGYEGDNTQKWKMLRSNASDKVATLTSAMPLATSESDGIQLV